SNLSHKDLNVMWGQHPFYGPPFIDAGCRIEIPATGYFDTADEPLLRRRWPNTEKGIDLRNVGTEDFPKGKMLFATDFDRGTYRIVNPTVKLAVEFNWEIEKFPYCWIYENAIPALKTTGRNYGLAMEPFTGLPKALEEGHGVLPVKALSSETTT